jgi:hypothetical protein
MPVKGLIDRKELLRREGAVLLLALGLLALAAALIASGLTVEPSRGKIAPAPWIFVAIQGLLLIFTPLLAGVFLPLFAVCLLSVLPFLPSKKHRLAKSLGIGIVAFWVLATLAFRVWFYWS